MSLYNKYRPKEFDQMIGNENTLEQLNKLLSNEEPPKAYLFTGQSGCGKTTLGRIVASILDCKGNDYREVDSADFRGIDTIREIRKQSHFKPLEGSSRVYLLDECHMMSNDAQNALLKALENPPSHVYYILCTTDPQKLLKTIIGRCVQFEVELLNEKQIKLLVKKIARKEGVKLADEVAEQIAIDSLGHARDAIQILEKVLTVTPDKQLEAAKQSAEIQSQTIELCRALVGGKSWKEVSRILTGLKNEQPESIRRAVLGYCSAILMKKEDDKIARIMEEMIEPFYNTGFPGLVFACYSILKG